MLRNTDAGKQVEWTSIIIYKVDVGVLGAVKLPVCSKDEKVLKVGQTTLLVICSHNKW